MVLHVGKTISPIFLWTLILMVLACAPDLSERMRIYVETYNTHDVDEIMTFYTDDVRFENVGVWVKTDKQEVRKITEWDATTHIVMKVSNVMVRGDTVTFSLLETNDWLKLAGIGEALYEPSRIVFKDGKIAIIQAKLTEESLNRWMPKWNSILAWATEHRPDRLAEVMPEGAFVFGADYARKWLELLEEWRQATEETE
ncbi:hypothetical protein AMJ87_08550 [candidate division WOR_3 bacterium SM23_60]|uniref:SnoaL-like domain-containing protein n=1 Tax=candidate division WOR_3 bacterium SM23_60 TaxID=1703780 RepID=A0A0S8GC65_UNCW3|nr:MAG: hypothetical protein AMJ87_08550 [candidate division WOR_3 bacterium SM23_60]